MGSWLDMERLVTVDPVTTATSVATTEFGVLDGACKVEGIAGPDGTSSDVAVAERESGGLVGSWLFGTVVEEPLRTFTFVIDVEEGLVPIGFSGAEVELLDIPEVEDEDTAQFGTNTASESSVSDANNPNARPFNATPVLRVTEERASIVPAKEVPTPIVADEPTCQ